MAPSLIWWSYLPKILGGAHAYCCCSYRPSLQRVFFLLSLSLVLHTELGLLLLLTYSTMYVSRSFIKTSLRLCSEFVKEAVRVSLCSQFCSS